MPNGYLKEEDFAAYGAPMATLAQVRQVSILIDAYLKRTHGLLHVADDEGRPVHMDNMYPTQVVAATHALAAGTDVAAGVTGPVDLLQLGDCLVLGRGTTKVETAQITSINGSNIRLSKLRFSHDFGVKMEAGMVIMEQKTLPKDRSIVRLSHAPVARVIGGTGRYGVTRRGRANSHAMDDFNLLAAVGQFGGPPPWELFVSGANDSLNSDSGEIWIPVGRLVARYTEVKIRYIAGWTYDNLPDAIKQATANLVIALNNNPILGDISRLQAADSHVEMISSSMISDDVKSLLAPYRAKVYA